MGATQPRGSVSTDVSSFHMQFLPLQEQTDASLGLCNKDAKGLQVLLGHAMATLWPTLDYFGIYLLLYFFNG